MRDPRSLPAVPKLGVALALLGVAVLFGCKDLGPREGEVRISERDSGGITVVTVTGDVRSLPEWVVDTQAIAEVSGDEPPFFGSIGEVGILSDGSFLVEDNQTHELRLFDSTGSVVRLVGGEGSGPGEFQNLTKLSVLPGDTFLTYDRRLYRISVFDPRGDLVKTVTLTREGEGRSTLGLDAWGFGSDRFVLHRMSPWDSTGSDTPPRRDQRDAVLFPLDGAGGVTGPPIRFTGGYSVEFSFGDASSPFSNRPIIAVGPGRLVYSSALDYQLTFASEDLQTRRIVRWSGWKRPLPPETVQELRADLEAGWEEIRAVRPDLVESLVEATFSPEILPDTLPVLGPAFLDDSGQLWVSRFIPTVYVWGKEDSWHVLDADGHPRARVRLPPGAQLTAVRGDRVALVFRDSLDVEDLRIHRVREDSGGREP